MFKTLKAVTKRSRSRAEACPLCLFLMVSYLFDTIENRSWVSIHAGSIYAATVIAAEVRTITVSDLPVNMVGHESE